MQVAAKPAIENGGERKMAQKPQETHADCVARVKRDYPVPPGNISAQNQVIREKCGSLAKKEDKGSEYIKDLGLVYATK